MRRKLYLAGLFLGLCFLAALGPLGLFLGLCFLAALGPMLRLGQSQA